MSEVTIFLEKLPKGSPGEVVRERYARIHVELRKRIYLLDYPPGERLSEKSIAAEYGISRTPIRQVLARLEGEGLVKSVHGIGTFVTDANLAELEQAYRLRIELAVLMRELSPRAPDTTLMYEIHALRTRSMELMIRYAENLHAARHGPIRSFDKTHRQSATGRN